MKISRHRFLVTLVLVLSALVISAANPAVFAAAPPATPKETVSRVVSLFVNWSGGGISHQTLSVQVAQYIDYDFMSALVLGQDHWSKLSPAQRKSFTAAFRKLIEQRYYTRWHRIFRHGKISYDSETISSKEAVVKTEITVGEEVDVVNWRLHLAQGSYKVVSLTTDHRDLLEILRPRFDKVLSRRGFDGLMTWLNRRAVSSQ